MAYKNIVPPAEGEKITLIDGELHIPDHPIIAFIEGDGIGQDIMTASKRILDAAVEKAYSGQRKIARRRLKFTTATTCQKRPSTRCASITSASRGR